jgi:hypothetical protein
MNFMGRHGFLLVALLNFGAALAFLMFPRALAPKRIPEAEKVWYIRRQGIFFAVSGLSWLVLFIVRTGG